MWISLLMYGCSTSSVPLEPSVATTGNVHVVVVPDSRIEVRPTGLGADAPGGRSWFDLVWTPAMPEVAARNWANTTCDPVYWDEPVQGDGWWAGGGMCTLSDRRHWSIVLARTTEDGTMLTVYLADYAFVPYEKAWVEFAATALTAGAGAPQTVLSKREVQERVRRGIAKGLGRAPMPGGGTISTRVHTEMRDVYDRLAVPSRSTP